MENKYYNMKLDDNGWMIRFTKSEWRSFMQKSETCESLLKLFPRCEFRLTTDDDKESVTVWWSKKRGWEFAKESPLWEKAPADSDEQPPHARRATLFNSGSFNFRS